MSSHESSHAPTAAHKPSLFWTVVWGYIMLTIFVVFVMFFIGFPAMAFENAEVIRERERIKIREEVLAAAKKELNEGPTWINKEKGTVRLPIQTAMTLTTERLNVKKPRAANPIEAPAAPAAPAAAPVTPAAAPAPTTPAAPAASTPPPAAPPK